MADSIWPAWFNSHGVKIGMRERYEGSGIAHLTSKRADLKIWRKDNRFRVEWHLSFSFDYEIQGVVTMTRDELLAAFGLNSDFRHSTKRLLDRYNADAGVEGKFIRQGNCLNIPMPGTGCDGDPNISIYLSDEVKGAVARELSPVHA